MQNSFFISIPSIRGLRLGLSFQDLHSSAKVLIQKNNNHFKYSAGCTHNLLNSGEGKPCSHNISKLNHLRLSDITDRSSPFLLRVRRLHSSWCHYKASTTANNHYKQGLQLQSSRDRSQNSINLIRFLDYDSFISLKNYMNRCNRCAAG